jgi:hypothetical protein
MARWARARPKAGLGRKSIMAPDASLRRLGMDYVDLRQIQRSDYETPTGKRWTRPSRLEGLLIDEEPRKLEAGYIPKPVLDQTLFTLCSKLQSGNG